MRRHAAATDTPLLPPAPAPRPPRPPAGGPVGSREPAGVAAGRHPRAVPAGRQRGGAEPRPAQRRASAPGRAAGRFLVSGRARAGCWRGWWQGHGWQARALGKSAGPSHMATSGPVAQQAASKPLTPPAPAGAPPRAQPHARHRRAPADPLRREAALETISQGRLTLQGPMILKQVRGHRRKRGCGVKCRGPGTLFCAASAVKADDSRALRLVGAWGSCRRSYLSRLRRSPVFAAPGLCGRRAAHPHLCGRRLKPKRDLGVSACPWTRIPILRALHARRLEWRWNRARGSPRPRAHRPGAGTRDARSRRRLCPLSPTSRSSPPCALALCAAARPSLLTTAAFATTLRPAAGSGALCRRCSTLTPSQRAATAACTRSRST